MIKHIVMWRIDESQGNKRNLSAEMKAKLEALPDVIPHIVRLEVGLNEKPSERASDVVLYTEFETWEDLQAYQEHPRHVEAVGFIKSITFEGRVVDFAA